MILKQREKKVLEVAQHLKKYKFGPTYLLVERY